MKQNFLTYKNKKQALTLILFLICNVFLCLYLFLGNVKRVDTNLLSLFPTDVFSNIDNDLTTHLVKRLDKQVVFLVKDNGDNKGESGKYFINKLKESNLFQKVNGFIDDDLKKEYAKFYYDYKVALLDDGIKEKILSKESRDLKDFIQSQIYLGFSGVSAKEILSDPFLLIRSYQMHVLSEQSNKIILKNDLLSVVDADNNTWYFIFCSLDTDGFDLHSSKDIVYTIKTLEQDLYTKFKASELLYRGSVFYNNEASTQAQRDISILGTLSIGIMLIIMYIAFKNVLPLFLCFLSIICASLVGTVSTILVFDSIHLITILISISIIGVGADYSIYFLSYAFYYGANRFKDEFYNVIKKTLFIALATTSLSYILMLVAPFPVISQISLFAISGLITILFIVLIFYPFLDVFYRKNLLKTSNFLKFNLHNIYAKYKLFIVLPFILFIAVYLPKIYIDHDITLLQNVSEDLKLKDKKISELTGQNTDQKFIFVFADNDDMLLDRAHNIYKTLNKLVDEKVLLSYQKFPLKSIQEQKDNLNIINNSFKDIEDFYKALGINVTNVYKDSKFLSIDNYINSNVSQGLNLLYLNIDKSKRILMIPLSGIEDKDRLESSLKAHAYSVFVDRKSEFDNLFEKCSNMLFIILCVSLAVVLLSLLIRYKLKRAILTFLPCIVSVLTAFAMLSFLDMPMNMFSLLAALLVVGVSVNYISFCSSVENSSDNVAIFAITMAMLTTIITLGVLVFSSTYAVSVFGMVLSIGIFTAFILAPLSFNYKD